MLGGPTAVARGEGQGRILGSAHHIIAKDILRFHAVYWPAMLESRACRRRRDLLPRLPDREGPEDLEVDPGDARRPDAIAAELGDGFVDPLRYFVLREYTLGGDGDFTYEALFQRYESDLGNDLGNLLNRTVSMAHDMSARSIRRLDRMPIQDSGADRGCDELAKPLGTAFDPSRALEATWSLVRAYNRRSTKQKPWVLAKIQPSRPSCRRCCASAARRCAGPRS